MVFVVLPNIIILFVIIEKNCRFGKKFELKVGNYSGWYFEKLPYEYSLPGPIEWACKLSAVVLIFKWYKVWNTLSNSFQHSKMEDIHKIDYWSSEGRSFVMRSLNP